MLVGTGDHVRPALKAETRSTWMLRCLFIMKPIRCTYFTNLFWHEILHVSGISSAHHQEYIHCTLGNGICHTGLKTALEQDQDGTAVPSWSCSKAVYKPVWHIPLLSVQWINSSRWTEEMSEICRVLCQNKFVKFVHLVGFIIKKFLKYGRFCDHFFKHEIQNSKKTSRIALNC